MCEVVLLRIVLCEVVICDFVCFELCVLLEELDECDCMVVVEEFVDIGDGYVVFEL